VSLQYVQIKKGQKEPETIRGSMEYDLWQLLYKEVKLTIGAGIGDPAAKQYIGTYASCDCVYTSCAWRPAINLSLVRTHHAGPVCVAFMRDHFFVASPTPSALSASSMHMHVPHAHAPYALHVWTVPLSLCICAHHL
jgi:hypothetical protein